MAFASTSTEFAMIDTRTTSGAFVLPFTREIPGRIINIKDAYGAFTNSSLTVYTQGGETFEDGTNFKVLNNSFEQLQVYTASTSRWYITGGTEQNITTTNIGVFSTLQTFNWPSLCNAANFGYGSTFNPTALGKISLLDNVFTSSTAGLVSTFIEMGNLNAQPTIMSTGGAFRWLMGVEPDGASMGRGLQFKIKRWNTFNSQPYGANISTLIDTVNINSLGNLGINTVNPVFTLDVAGTMRCFSSFVQNNSISGQNLTATDAIAADIGLFGGTAAAPPYPFYGPHIRSVIPRNQFQDQMRLDITTSAAANDNTQIPRISVLAGSGGSGNVGINTSTPSYQFDVNGIGRSRIIISTLTTNPTFAANSYGTYYNMSNTGITGASLPALVAADNGWFVVMRNNTAVTLNMTWTGTILGLPASSNTIPASNSLTLAWNGSAYIYY